MANVLILYIQPIIDENNQNAMVCFYESLAKELIDNGNNILCLNILNYKEYYKTVFKSKIKYTEEIILKIKNHNPDLIIAFNNQIVEEIVQCTNCPILLAEADAVDRFSGKELIRKYNDRYYMVSFSPGFEENRYIELGFPKDKIILLHMATSIRTEKLEKNKNISFIGSCFYNEYDDNMIKKITYNNDFYNDLIKYYEEPYNNYKLFTEKYIKIFDNNIQLLHQFMDLRATTLSSVADLGLNLYGINFDKLSPELFVLRAAFNRSPKYTLKHNQDIYNSSKINFSISHIQCMGYGFPWRIYDIMASNGLLVSSYSKLLEEKTKGIVDIPMFKSPYDAHDLCKYALKNQSYCEDIIHKSNAYIEKYGRWKSNFEILQNTIGIQLINNNEKKTKVIILESQIQKKQHLFNKNIVKRFKILVYSLCLAFSQLPLLNLVFKDNKKLKNKIRRWWH